MRPYRIIYTAAALALSIGVQAQIMTLKDCLEEGIRESYQIKLVNISEEKTANNDSWLYAGGSPTLTATGSYSGSLSSNDATLASDGSTVSNRNVLDHTLSAQLRADWTVFDGFSIQATRDRLEELHNQGTIQTRIAIEDYIATLTTEYYNLVRQTIHLKNLEYAASLSKERLRISSERYDMGGNSRLEMQQAQVYFNSDSAKSLKQHESVASANIRINRLMSNQDLRSVHVAADTAINLLTGLDYESLYDDMMKTNASLLRAESNRALAQLDRRTVQARNYPYIRLNASYGITHNIYGNSTYTDRTNWGPSFGATMGINLITGKQRVQERNARLDELTADITIDQLELQLRANLNDFWQAYQNNLMLLELQEQNLKTAQETMEIAQERYMLGNLSGLEMREAQKSLLDAEESLLQVQYDTKVCEISLLQISGRITQYLQ
ncbi:MAG: TolC family protein [Bacteroidaceae bacterium]|nr:TolC family protein [Bacteroidaceae bacterium]